MADPMNPVNPGRRHVWRAMSSWAIRASITRNAAPTTARPARRSASTTNDPATATGAAHSSIGATYRPVKLTRESSRRSPMIVSTRNTIHEGARLVASCPHAHRTIDAAPVAAPSICSSRVGEFCQRQMPR